MQICLFLSRGMIRREPTGMFLARDTSTDRMTKADEETKLSFPILKTPYSEQCSFSPTRGSCQKFKITIVSRSPVILGALSFPGCFCGAYWDGIAQLGRNEQNRAATQTSTVKIRLIDEHAVQRRRRREPETWSVPDCIALLDGGERHISTHY